MSNPKQYNINELLEYKKELEANVEEKMNEITNESLKYEEIKSIDHKNSKRNKTYKPREQVNLQEYYQQLFGFIDELAKVKIAIQKYNADKILALLQQRDAMRKKHSALIKIKANLPKKKHRATVPVRENEDGEVLETEEHVSEPMFPVKDVETQLSQFAAEERKTNTKIQQMNLSAKVKLE